MLRLFCSKKFVDILRNGFIRHVNTLEIDTAQCCYMNI